MKKLDILENRVKYSYLAIGSNIGNRKINIEKAKELLILNNIKIVKSSSYYLTKSWPNTKFPEFFNIVIKIIVNMNAIDLFNILKKIEIILGRKPSKRNYPRICDIDIIDFNGEIINLKKILI